MAVDLVTKIDEGFQAISNKVQKAALLSGIGVNVKKYSNVLGNGSNDDTDGIQAASIEAGQGGCVVFPKGEYIISRTITIPIDQIWIGFNGQANIPKNGVTINSRVYDGPMLVGSHAKINGIKLYGPGATAYPNSVGIYQEGQTCIRDSSIFDFGVGLDMYKSWYTHVDRLFVRYCGTGVRQNYCYNSSFYNLRVQAVLLSGVYGTGMSITDSTMTTLHGGSIEQYQNGIDMLTAGQTVSLFGTYMETYAPKASGIRLRAKNNVLVHGCQVYLDNHEGWINAAASTAQYSTINAMGTKFKTAKDNTSGTTCYAYFMTDQVALTTLSDNWQGVTNTDYGFRNLTVNQGAGMIMDPVGVNTKDGFAGGGVVVSGSNGLGFENNRTIRLGQGGLPSNGSNGDLRLDPATGKLKYWWNNKWNTVTST